MNALLETLQSWLTRTGFDLDQSAWVAKILVLLTLLALCAGGLWITRAVLLRFVRAASARTGVKWDDELVNAGVFARLSYLVPAILFASGARTIFVGDPEAIQVVETLVSVALTVIALGVVSALLRAVGATFENHPVSRRLPTRVVQQVLQGVLFFIGSVILLSQLLDRSPLVFLSGLSAIGAISMLVFKDTILGLVAGIQLSANNMVRRGDWIEMPNQGADGDVIDVGLTTVKVQNWDKTITTIPTYALISESFKNWRGMSDSGGRRIKRSVSIDMTSIRFCDEEMFERFQRIQLLSDYLERRIQEISHHNDVTRADTELLVNGRHLTNVGTFRAYLIAYLRQHSQIHQDMTFLVRQLQPTDKGLPIEIYVFSADKDWVNYEAIQADIFDHVLAVLPLFDLRIFQAPTGADMRAFANPAP